MLTAIRRTLEHELRTNPRVLVFGEDVGPKGGVHAATMGLQDMFGDKRVFDTSLSEEGIIGRAVGMAIAGLMPVAEIQFRKYADPATEQLNNCGTIRWRTANRFAAPIVVRLPGGFAKVGDPWHSVSGEVMWAHAIGWQMCFPSNAEDAVGLLRAALRSNNPTIFFEHRHLLDGPWARRPYPGDDYVLPMGKAKITQTGNTLTVVTWGAMVERCELAAKKVGESIEIIDLRTISPWDRETVLDSVSRTRRCLIVHEDGITSGFGAEVAAVVAEHSFFNLDAPITRLGIPDVPVPHNFGLMEAVVPGVDSIAKKMSEVIEA
jgi:2-oxoisovalerate dehydrogenase E1 component